MNIILVSLAVWRVSSLLVQEDGPFDILKNLRASVALRASELMNKEEPSRKWQRAQQKSQSKIYTTISNGIHCIWCVSLWISPIISLAISNTLVEWVIYTLSTSALAILFDLVIGKLNG